MSETDTVEAVQAYIARLELEREKDGVTLRQADFESIAEELGLDAEARADLERRASEHMMRGEGFLSQELIADAVKSFEIARELQPWSLEPVKFLARSHAQGWKLEGETESRVASRLYCEQWIGRQPADKEPYSLMKSLKERADRKKIFRLASLFIGVGVVAAMAGIFTVKSFETLEGQVDQMRVRAELTQTPIQSTAATQEVSVELQVLESNSKLNGLELDLRGSKIGHLDFMEPHKTWITITGYLHNGSAHEIRELKLELRYLNAEGEVVWTELESVLGSMDPGHRPGDLIPFWSYVEEEMPDSALDDVEKVVIVPGLSDLGAGAEAYDPSPVVELSWLNPPGSHISLELRERSYRAGENHHKAVYELENTGDQDLEMIQLQQVWKGEGGEVLESNWFYAVSSDPRLAPGDVVLFDTIASSPGQPTRPEIEVLEYR